jgi:hypothetical protein
MLSMLLRNASRLLKLNNYIVACPIQSVRAAVRKLNNVWLAHEDALLKMHDSTKSHNRPTYKAEMLRLGIKYAELASERVATRKSAP